MIKKSILFLVIILITGCVTKPPELTSGCPQWGSRCQQYWINR